MVLVATLGLARWSFEQGFLDYVNALEQTRLERVQLDLADEYLVAGGSWKALNEQRFATLLRQSVPRELQGGPPPGSMPPPYAADRKNPPPLMREPGAQRRGAQGFPPTALYDMDGNLVAGISLDVNDSPAIRVPVVVDGAIVGELRSEPRRQFISPQETQFSRQQLKTS